MRIRVIKMIAFPVSTKGAWLVSKLKGPKAQRSHVKNNIAILMVLVVSVKQHVVELRTVRDVLVAATGAKLGEEKSSLITMICFSPVERREEGSRSRKYQADCSYCVTYQYQPHTIHTFLKYSFL